MAIGRIHESTLGWCFIQGTQKTTVKGQVYFESRGELSDALRSLGLHPRRDKSVTKDEPLEDEGGDSPEDPLDPALKYGNNTGPANEPTENDVLKYAAKGDEETAPAKETKGSAKQ